jgi:hypothetical protein
MKKNYFILLVAVLLAVVSIFLVYQNKSGTINKELHDFAVGDTAAVTKIFLADKNNHSVTLERKNKSEWKVNGKFKARPEGIKTILITMKNLSVKTRIAKAAYNGVIRDIAANGIKCEIYQHGEDKPAKVYYVGGSTADVLVTFMMIENSTLPFVMEIPGFLGYLTTRYTPVEKDWRDMTAYDYSPSEIRNITVRYFQQPSKSFSIEKSGNQIKVLSAETNQPIQHVDTIGLLNYLSYFRSLCFEGWDVDFSKYQQDSLKTTTPFNLISVTDVSGATKSIATFPKPITLRSMARVDNNGNPLKYDLDRLYAYLQEEKELVVIQYNVFGKIFRQLDDFDLDKKKEPVNSKRK